MNSKLTTAALAALLITTFGQAAHATPTEEVVTRTVRVEFRRSEIGNEAGARQLLERLERASRRACSYDGPALSAGRNYRACIQSAQAEAVKKINSPMLTAVHGGPAMQLATR